MRLVEDDDALELGLLSPTREPGDDLLQPVDAGLDAVALAGLALERVVAREADALGPRDGSLARAEVEDEVGRAAERGPVADGVAHQVAVLGHPEGAAAALEDVVEDDPGRFSPFADSGRVADEEALPGTRSPGLAREVPEVGGPGAADGFELGVGERALGHEVLGQRRAVVARWRAGRGHRGRLDEPRRVRAGARDPDARAVGVEHARCERAGLGHLLGGLDRQRLGVSRRATSARPRRRQRRPPRGLGRSAVPRRATAGCEEGEEVELFDRGVRRS